MSSMLNVDEPTVVLYSRSTNHRAGRYLEYNDGVISLSLSPSFRVHGRALFVLRVTGDSSESFFHEALY